MTWVRSGTLMNHGVTEIDVTNNKGDWISIKGQSDKRSEELSKSLLALLNAHDVIHQQNDNGFALCGVDMVTIVEEPKAVTCDGCKEARS